MIFQCKPYIFLCPNSKDFNGKSYKSTFSTSNVPISELKRISKVFLAAKKSNSSMLDRLRTFLEASDRSDPDMISRACFFFSFFYLPLGFRAPPEEIFCTVITVWDQMNFYGEFPP